MLNKTKSKSFILKRPITCQIFKASKIPPGLVYKINKIQNE